MMGGRGGTSFPAGPICFTKGYHSKSRIVSAKTNENIENVRKDKVIPNKHKKRKDTLPFKIERGLAATGKDRMAHGSREVGTHSKIALSAPFSGDIRHSSKDLNLVRFDCQ